MEDIDNTIREVKSLRADIDAIIQRAKSLPRSREQALAHTHLQESVMWLGMVLKEIGATNPEKLANPYPNSKDPSNTVIDRTADGLKL